MNAHRRENTCVQSPATVVCIQILCCFLLPTLEVGRISYKAPHTTTTLEPGVINDTSARAFLFNNFACVAYVFLKLNSGTTPPPGPLLPSSLLLPCYSPARGCSALFFVAVWAASLPVDVFVSPPISRTTWRVYSAQLTAGLIVRLTEIGSGAVCGLSSGGDDIGCQQWKCGWLPFICWTICCTGNSSKWQSVDVDDDDDNDYGDMVFWSRRASERAPPVRLLLLSWCCVGSLACLPALPPHCHLNECQLCWITTHKCTFYYIKRGG